MYVVWMMPSVTTLEFVAGIIVKRVVEECAGADKVTLHSALQSACPFPELPEGPTIWRKAIRGVLIENEVRIEKRPQTITHSHGKQQLEPSQSEKPGS